MNRRICFASVLCLSLLTGATFCSAQTATEPTIRVGLIGLDTSHAGAFTKELNATKAEGDSPRLRVTVAYPYGSRTIESSASRIPKITAEIKALGVEVVDSIDALLKQVDCVLLETNDGTLHREQAAQIFAAGKPVFIDKPVAASLQDVVAIFDAAKASGVPMFSSSALRYGNQTQAIRNGSLGRVLGCDAFSPCSLEPSHSDLFWYGIHGVETLFTCMGPGCESVTRVSTEDYDLVVGKWSDGRIGTFRGIRKGGSGYGGTVFGEQRVEALGKFEGYKPLTVAITSFFRTGKPPIDPVETIEIYAFMEAAAESKRQGGVPVSIASVIEKARAANP